MTKKLLLTIPALLAGPLLVLLITFTIYDFSVIGGTITMAVISFGTVRSVWTKKEDQHVTPAPEGR
jgi:hypothetical protein